MMSMSLCSQTGLVPASYKQRQDLRSYIHNWRKLPPRPPPELYPYKGDLVVQKRNKCFKQFDTHQSTCNKSSVNKSDKIEKVRPSTGRKGKPSWDPSLNDMAIHQYDPTQREKMSRIRTNCLDYIRKSASRRDLLAHFQRQLEMDLAQEGRGMGNDQTDLPRIPFEPTNDIVEEIKQLKKFIKDNESDDLFSFLNYQDHHITQDWKWKNLERLNRRVDKTNEWSVKKKWIPVHEHEPYNMTDTVGLKFDEPVIKMDSFVGKTVITNDTDVSSATFDKLIHAVVQTDIKPILTKPSIKINDSIRETAKNNDTDKRSTSSGELIQAVIQTNIESSSGLKENPKEFFLPDKIWDGNENEEFKRFASAIADGILATIRY